MLQFQNHPQKEWQLLLALVENLAPKPASLEQPRRAPDRRNEVALAANRALREGDAPAIRAITPTAVGAETEDMLTFGKGEGFDEAPFPENDEDFSSGEVVITIAGGGGSSAGPRAITTTNASYIAPTKIPAPHASLLRSTPLGDVPKISSDGRRPSTYYARPFDGAEDTPRIAIVVGGLGLNATLTERAIDDLPPDISLAFAPYAKNLEFWTEKARNAGHEVLIELPMDSHGASQSALGAAALLNSHSTEENLQRLDWLLSRFGGYFAATNYLGGKFSANADALTPILSRLKQSGVSYIDDTGAAAKAGARSGVEWTLVDRMIPPAPDASKAGRVKRELNALENLAQRNGVALGKTYAYGATIDELVRWSDELAEKNVSIAPASSILQNKAAMQ